MKEQLSIGFLFIFVPFLAIVILALTIVFAPHRPYPEKDSSFECGFCSFLWMNRIEFNISFYIFGLLFLLFDLEILLVYPYTVSNSNNSVYGGLVAIIFLLLLTVGFCYEVGRRALQINSRQSGHLYASKSDIIEKK